MYYHLVKLLVKFVEVRLGTESHSVHVVSARFVGPLTELSRGFSECHVGLHGGVKNHILVGIAGHQSVDASLLVEEERDTHGTLSGGDPLLPGLWVYVEHMAPSCEHRLVGHDRTNTIYLLLTQAILRQA